MGQMLELGMAAPQVVAHRLARMAAAGAAPSARDRKEFVGMVLEKQAAFAQGWTAMWIEGWLAQQKFALAWMSGKPWTSRDTARASAALERIATRGIAPVHRKAVANARRLARSRQD
ncbi:hypothetical protein MNQ95_08915 [Pseudoxanthomonas daejeonensis]|uniref:polyhydroxyalkanoate granule-associated phasin n=1 Tax=Pseudoxanthomonas daejeonensis TaxID=266062 RepID=UPI00192EC5AC|nr:polyhydroxyalkanoate granule-associated phasin [Pseudoxanthomonas daejeonensis]UNK56296.1 hypothetical protein MNQ95_08915 [Pseudoxanthomonas daejeonensis]